MRNIGNCIAFENKFGCKYEGQDSSYKRNNNTIRVFVTEGDALKLEVRLVDYDELSDDDDVCIINQMTPSRTLEQWASISDEEYFIEGIQPEVEEKVRQAIDAFADLGAEVSQVSLLHTSYALPVYYIIAPSEASANLARFDGVRYGLRVENTDMIEMFKHTRGAGFGEEVKRRIMLGTYALSAGYYEAFYGQAQKVRTLIQRDFLTAFEQVDVIAAPVAPTTAFKIGEHTDDPLAMYLEDVFTLPANLAGVPGLAFPVGFDQYGLPVGMQLMGRHFEEERLFQAVHAYQGATDWHTHRPLLLM